MERLSPQRQSELTALNQTLKSEADGLLYDRGLLAALQKYGEVHITGSYLLDTMAWRDLDLYLDDSGMSGEDHFRLAYDIFAAIHPHRMTYQLHENTPGLPRGVYWGIQSNEIPPNTWKIDLWVIPPDLCAEYMANSERLKARIGESDRLCILDVKGALWSHPRYRRDFTSMDIYAAVLDHGVDGPKDFARWLKAVKGIEG